MMLTLVNIELNAFYDVKIDSDVILCNVQTKINKETLTYPGAYCDTWSLCLVTMVM